MFRKRGMQWLFLWMIGVCIVFIVDGCQFFNHGDASGDEDKTVQLHLWGNQSYGEFSSIIDAFENEYPSIKVIYHQ